MIKQISPLKVLPDKTKYGFKIRSRVKGNLLRTWYILPSNKRNIEFIFPRYLKVTQNFICALGLSIGEGLNNPNKRNIHYNFANTNVHLVKFVYAWLVRDLGVKKDAIRIYANIPEGNSNKKAVLDSLISELKISKDAIKGYFNVRNKKVSIMLQISNSIFQSFYLNLFNSLKREIINDADYRISFLKGLFAAEGHVKHSVYGTIESIGFAFNPETEVHLSRFVKRCLNLEGIVCNINKKKGYLYFCGYENMLRFFLSGAMDLHEDKKRKFMSLTKNSVVHVHFKKRGLDNLSKFSQLELSRKLGVSQPLISHWKKYCCIGLGDSARIFPILQIGLGKFIENIRFLKITNSCIRDRKSIKFLLSFHDFQKVPFKIEVKRNRRRSNKSALFAILKDLNEASKDDGIYLGGVRKISHLHKVTLQQRLRKLEREGYLKHVKMRGLSKVYEFTKRGELEYQNLNALYEGG